MASKGSFQLKRFYDFLQVIINTKKESQQQKPQPTNRLLIAGKFKSPKSRSCFKAQDTSNNQQTGNNPYKCLLIKNKSLTSLPMHNCINLQERMHDEVQMFFTVYILMRQILPTFILSCEEYMGKNHVVHPKLQISQSKQHFQ